MVASAAPTSTALPACVKNFAQMGRQEGEKRVTGLGLDPPESDDGGKSPLKFLTSSLWVTCSLHGAKQLGT